jgi:G3E family GTPase
MKRKDRLDAILIETTGLANPAPVAQTFFTDDEMKQQFRLDAIVTLVDAKHILQHLDDSPEALKQVGFADVILLNKTDLVTPAELDALEKRLHAINAVAKIHRTKNADIEPRQGAQRRRLQPLPRRRGRPAVPRAEYPFEWAGAYPNWRRAPTTSKSARTTTARSRPCPRPRMGEACGHHHGNSNELDVVVTPVRSAAQADIDTVIETGDRLLRLGEDHAARRDRRPGGKMHRLKLKDESGHFPLAIEQAGHYVVFDRPAVPTRCTSPTGKSSAGWQQDLHATSTRTTRRCRPSASPRRGRARRQETQRLDLEAARRERRRHLPHEGRAGVKGTNKRLVFQGVHMLFDAKFDREWKDGENRTNTLVFIGKHLDRAALTEGFKACLA